MAEKLPFDEDFQNACVAYLWKHGNAFAEHREHLEASFFESSVNVSIFDFVGNYFAEFKKTPSKIALKEIVRGVYPTESKEHSLQREAIDTRLKVLEEIDISDHKFIDKRIREFVRFSSLKAFVYETYEDLEKGVIPEDLPSKARKALTVGTEFSAGHDWKAEAGIRIREASQPESTLRVPTGIQHLDREIGGGLAGGELGIILALPKGFKSGGMLNFGYGAMRRDLYKATSMADIKTSNVCYFTMELSEDLVANRYDRRSSKFTIGQLRSDPDAYKARLDWNMNVEMPDSQLFIKGYKTKQATCDMFRSYLDRMYEDYDITFVEMIVDYLDLVKPSKSRGEKDYLEAVEICEDLRDIGIEYNIPVWTACRATREAVGASRISMKHMSKAFERIGVADLVLAFCQTEEEKHNQQLRMAVVAARNDAGDKIINCTVDYPKMLLKSVGVSELEYDDDSGSKKNSGGGTASVKSKKENSLAAQAAKGKDQDDDGF
jgi:hypothetical protein